MKPNEAPETYSIQFSDKLDEYLWKEHHFLGGCCPAMEVIKYLVAREMVTKAVVENACRFLKSHPLRHT